MPERLKTLAWVLVGVASLAGAFFAVRASVSEPELSEIEFDIGRLILASAVFTASFLYAALLWHDFLRLGGAESSRREDAASWLVSQFGKYVPGNVTVIAIRMARSSGRPAGVAAAAVQEAAFQVVVGALFAIPALTSLLRIGEGASWWIFLAGLPFLAVVVLPGRFDALLNWALKKVGRSPLASRPATPGETVKLLLAYALFWVLAGTSFWLFANAIGLDISWLTATSAVALAWIVGFLAVTVPAGLGVREAALVAVLGPEFGPGAVLTVAIAQRAWVTILYLILAGSGFLLSASGFGLNRASKFVGR